MPGFAKSASKERQWECCTPTLSGVSIASAYFLLLEKIVRTVTPPNFKIAIQGGEFILSADSPAHFFRKYDIVDSTSPHTGYCRICMKTIIREYSLDGIAYHVRSRDCRPISDDLRDVVVSEARGWHEQLPVDLGHCSRRIQRSQNSTICKQEMKDNS